MNRFLQQVYFDNTVLDYLRAAGVIVLVLLLHRLLARYLAHLSGKLFKRKWKDLDEKSFADLVSRPLSVFLLVTVLTIALYGLKFPAQLNFSIYKYTIQSVLITVGIVIQIIAFIWLLLRIIDFIAMLLEKRANLTPDLSDNQLIVFFKDFLKVVLIIIGMLMILHMAFNYNVSSLLTGLSIVGAAIALALRESLENLIASFIIFFDKPFTTGDTVKVQSVSGTVERIGLRSTRIRTVDKSYVTVPNKQMVDSILDNVSLRSQIRGELTLNIHLQTPPDKIEALISQVKGYLAGIEEIQGSSVLFNDIRVQAFIVFIEFFTIPVEGNRFNAIRQQLNLFVLQTLEQLDVKIAAEGKDLSFTA